MKFTYRCGDKPLRGYTIKRGIGYGGFGEVYFAVSDGGKEVALKWIRANHDVELRGIQQCLNLKHPHLLHLYDLRNDDKGFPWLVMEHVAGESLQTILCRHPKGVAVELAAEWFRGIADAVHHLHENGIVHRDLKPGNIFLENGVIKIGDYGLCKSIGSQRGGMTQNVGTCQYMAPEISTGNYNREIDTYAAGIILFEMLTGKVPFNGQSTAEVLMKHLTATPDLRGVPSEFAPLLEQALAKNPAHRFQNLAEMGRKVLGLARIKFEPKDHSPLSASPKPLPTVRLASPVDVFFSSARTRFADLAQMLVLSFVCTTLLTSVWSLFFGGGSWSYFTNLFFTTIFCCWGTLVPLKLMAPFQLDDTWTKRLIMLVSGFLVGFLVVWLQGYDVPFPGHPVHNANAMNPWDPAEMTSRARGSFLAVFSENRSMPILACYLGYFGLAFFFPRWQFVNDPQRKHRFRFDSLAVMAFWAFVLAFLLPSAEHRYPAYFGLLATNIICQLISPARGVTNGTRAKKLRLAKSANLQGVAV